MKRSTLLSIAAVMGSIVLIDLKVLGLALPSQNTGELVRRLMPWTWWALPSLAVSGLVFVLARPASYFVNPVFRLKFTMLVPAVILAAILYHAGTWFRLTSHILVVRLGRLVVPRKVVISGLVALWLLVSGLVLQLYARF